MAQFTDKEQAESYCTALKKETDERTAADWLAVEKAKFLAENEPVPALPKERDYRVGDTIRLDGKDFTVETVGTLNIQLVTRMRSIRLPARKARKIWNGCCASRATSICTT